MSSRLLVTEPIYHVLGPLTVSAADGNLKIPPGRQQVVLSALLLEANRVVGMDSLVDAIWNDAPPATARTQVQICVSSLRSTLAGVGSADAIVTRPPGYLLKVSDGELDAHVFARLTAEAEAAIRAGDAGSASALLRQALALWRGPALGGTTSRALHARATQLDEERLAALETSIDLELAAGRHHQLVGEISALVAQHPLRERMRGQLMLALYRSGRQPEALDVYRSARDLLIDELGLEPSEELRRLEAAILAGDPALLVALPVREAEAPPAPPEAVIPFQLPADIGDFTGRTDLIEQAEVLLTGARRATRVLALVGKPGVGKSALAVHIAHRLGDEHFPDGQLYCDMMGTRATPTTAADVLGRFLRALGIPGTSIPDAVDERAEMYRQLVAHKQVLIVLDDVAVEGNVQALLPGSGTCAVIVTSRARLTGLPGARVLDVDVLGLDVAIEMLATVVGRERVDSEPATAVALIRLVGGLPLALRIVAARLAARRAWSLAWMLERLSDERRRLDELSHGEMMVRASLALSYDGLEPDARRLLRLLGVLDGLSFPTWVAAALLDVDLLRAADLLELLVDMQMMEIVAIEVGGSPRYKFHDLIRLFAKEQSHESTAEPLDALGRVVGGWLALTGEAHSRVYGGDFTVLHGSAPRWRLPESSVDRMLADPMAWLEAEHSNLCSVVALTANEGMAEACWDLAVSMVTLFEARCYFDDWQRTHEQALAAVRAAGNQRGEGALSCSLASLQLSWSRGRGAEDLLKTALTTFQELDDVLGLAMTRRNLALSHHRRGEVAQAEREYLDALEGFRRAADPVGQAYVLTQLAQIDLQRGLVEPAATSLHEALELCRRSGNRRVEVQARYRLCDLMVRQGEYRRAETALTDLLDGVRALHDIVGEARVLHLLATVKLTLDDGAAAEELLRTALEVHERAMDHAGAAESRTELALVLADRGDRPQAVELLDSAITVFAERNMTASRQRAVRALESLGTG